MIKYRFYCVYLFKYQLLTHTQNRRILILTIKRAYVAKNRTYPAI